MARTTIEFPSTFTFYATIPVRITDVNYGGHVGNDAILSIIHEARLQFLNSYGYSETDIGGAGMIMSEVSIIFKHGLFYGNTLRVHVAVTNISRASFDLVYKLETDREGKTIDIAHARTAMVCFDYQRRRVTALPDAIKSAWTGGSDPA